MTSLSSDIWLPSSMSSADVVNERIRAASTPAGMRDRMYVQLRHRLPLVSKLMDYYEGRHAFSFATAGFQAHAKMLASVSDNFMPLACTSRASRMNIEGLKVASVDRPASGDTVDESWAPWDLWRRSDLDEHSPTGWLEAVKLGEAYFLAEVVGERNGRPDVRVTIEHPASMVIARAPGDPSRATAALKSWFDEWGVEHATLWTPTTIYRWSRVGSREWAAKGNGLGEQGNPFAPSVPVIPITHDPQTLPARPPQILISPPHGLRDDLSVGFGRSVMLDVIETQDACNKLVRDMLIAAEYQSFRQRWVAGFTPEKDKDGNPINPFRAGPGQLWMSTNSETKFGEFAEGSLEPYLKAIESRVTSIASRTSTPSHYFTGLAGIMPSGETLRATEAGLSSKCKDMQRPFGGASRRLMGVVLPVTNPELNGTRVDPDWTDPEVRTQSEYMDSLVKKMSIGVPVRQLWEDAGYTPEQIDRFGGWIREQARERAEIAQLTGATERPDLPASMTDVGAGTPPVPAPAG